MPNGKYDFDYDEPVSIPLDTETTLRAMLDINPDLESDEEDAEAAT
jgi:hypothetical protein